MLDKLGALHGTDKSPIFDGSRVNRGWMKGHSYTPFYYEIFRTIKVRRLLEIGIDQGNSLRMWRDFFPEADIFGIDVNRSALFDGDRIYTFCCNATDEQSINTFINMTMSPYSSPSECFDIVIDDGSHAPSDQVKTAKLLLPYTKPSGYYIIEDCTLESISILRESFKVVSCITFDPNFETKDDRLCLIHDHKLTL